MHTQEFINKVKTMASLDNDKEAMKLIQVVFMNIHSRLLEGEADNIEATLPTQLQTVWEKGFENRWAKPRPVERFNKEQLLNRISNQAKIGEISETEWKTKAVMHVLKEAIPEGEVRDAAAEFPPDIRALWLSA